MLRSPQRRPRLPQKPPSDILTLQSKRHLNLVATFCRFGLLRKTAAWAPDGFAVHYAAKLAVYHKCLACFVEDSAQTGAFNLGDDSGERQALQLPNPRNCGENKR